MSALRVLDTKPVIRRSLAESLLACTEYADEHGEAASFGSAFHVFHAAHTLTCKTERVDSLDSDAVRRLAAEAFDLERGVPESRREEFLEVCRRYTDTHTADLATLIDVERTLTFDAGWALLTCTVDRLDRLDGGDPDDDPTILRIVDRKSGFADIYGKVDHSFQERWYVQMAFLSFPSAGWVYWELDPIRAAMPQDAIRYERGELDEWWAETLQRVRVAWEEREAGRGKPKGGNACQFCAKRFDCAGAIEPWRSAPENLDQAAEQFQDLIRLTEAVAVRKKALEAFFSEREPVVIAGHEVGWLTPREDSFKVTGDPIAVKAALDGRGLDGAEFLKVGLISNKGIRDILIGAELAQYERSKAEFKWRKAGKS